jgi:hypothetical protein
MGRIIFNEDPNHFIYSRAKAGCKKITKEDLVDFIKQYEGTDVTDFMICVGASIPWYRSERLKDVITQYKEWVRDGKDKLYMGGETELVFSCIGLLVDYTEECGESFYDTWIPTLREIGIRPWLSIRMNDIHECTQEDSILFSDFYRENREHNRASHRGAIGYFDYALDYMNENVREHYLTVIEDALESFDADGLELDWMREIYSITIGREYEGIAVINAFMREVYAMVKRMEEKRGHKIPIAVRLPDTPEKALRLGFDVFDWVENGLIELITVTPRWSSVDNDMPIDLWKRIFKGKPVEIAAGLEILIDAYNRRGRKYEYNTLETAVGSACANLWQGADATYLFNYMDEIPTTKGHHDFLTGGRYREFLKTVGDYEKCVSATRRHVVTYNDVSAIGAEGKKQLPVRLWGDGKPSNYQALRLVTGDIPRSRRVNVILGIEADGDFDVSALFVYLSAKKCDFLEERAPFAQQYTDMRYFVYTLENDGTLPPVSVIEMGLSEGKATVHWAEIEIL